MGNKILLEMDRGEAMAVAEKLAGNPETDRISIHLRNALGEPEIHVFHWENDDNVECRLFHQDEESILFQQLDDDENWTTIMNLGSDIDMSKAYKDGSLVALLEELAIVLLTQADALDEEE